ncbi:hypothetical protein ACFR9U_14370 [Halorientalis brevis]|uniref:Uncharacterized protein n=1 Tax=Halorientalis brevis TaxID=1126241 RepID=A0ABD6CE69_9EURY|nr:hypothetical protein [Halorientalis brevis]
MDDRDDPMEPRGVVYDDLQRDSTSSRGNYPDDMSADRRTCPSCSRTVPPHQTQCEFCAEHGIRSPNAAQGSPADDEWSFGRVVLSIVPADTEYMAQALGAAAFSLAATTDLAPGCRDAEVKPVGAFETAPAEHLTAGWGDLVDSVETDTDTGHRLLDTASEQTDWTAEQPLAHLFTEDGTAIMSRSEVRDLREEISAADEQFWVVPGVVKRYDSTLPVIPDAPTRQLQCRECHGDTEHRFTGRSTTRDSGWPVWVCTECHQPRFGREPDGTQFASVSDPFGNLDHWTPADTHQRVLTAYFERHGHYPWETPVGNED